MQETKIHNPAQHRAMEAARTEGGTLRCLSVRVFSFLGYEALCAYSKKRRS